MVATALIVCHKDGKNKVRRLENGWRVDEAVYTVPQNKMS